MQWNKISLMTLKTAFWLTTLGVLSLAAAVPQRGKPMQAEPYGPSQELPPDVDGDRDGWADEVEKALGSDPANAASTPESQAVWGSCIDGADNDLDGASDSEDRDPEPSCGQVDVSGQIEQRRFPEAGIDAFPSEMEISDVGQLLRESKYPECSRYGERIPEGVSIRAKGPTVIRRGGREPGQTGGNGIDVSIVALQASGMMSVPGFAPIPVTIIQKPGQPSPGRVEPLQEGSDFPARGFFTVGVEILTEPRTEGPPIPERIRCIEKELENLSIKTLPPVDDKNDCYQGPFARHCVKPPRDVPIKQRPEKDGEIQPKYVYSVKFVCGKIAEVSPHKGQPPFEPGDLFGAAHEPPVKPGNYATAINIHNPHPKPVIFAKKAVLSPREPKKGKPSPFHTMRLGADEATEVDCPDIARILGMDPGTPFAKGFAVIESPITLDVVAVYTQEVAKETVLDKITCQLRKGWGKSGRAPDPFVVLVQPPEGAVPDLAPGAVGIAYDPKPFCIEGLKKAGFAVEPGATVKILDIDIGVGKGVGSSIDVEHIEPQIIERLPPIQIGDAYKKPRSDY